MHTSFQEGDRYCLNEITWLYQTLVGHVFHFHLEGVKEGEITLLYQTLVGHIFHSHLEDVKEGEIALLFQTLLGHIFHSHLEGVKDSVLGKTDTWLITIEWGDF